MDLTNKNKIGVMHQREQRQKALNEEIFLNMTQPHIEGDQGYPQVPQLTTDEETKIKKE